MADKINICITQISLDFMFQKAESVFSLPNNGG